MVKGSPSANVFTYSKTLNIQPSVIQIFYFINSYITEPTLSFTVILYVNVYSLLQTLDYLNNNLAKYSTGMFGRE